MIKRIVAFLVVMSIGTLTYWLNGGNFDRGPELGLAFLISIWLAGIAATFTDLK